MKRSLVHHPNGSLPLKKKKKTVHFPAEFGPACLIDLTTDEFPESLILKPKTNVTIIDLTPDGNPESLIEVPAKKVDFIDRTVSSHKSKPSKDKPIQHDASESSNVPKPTVVKLADWFSFQPHKLQPPSCPPLLSTLLSVPTVTTTKARHTKRKLHNVTKRAKVPQQKSVIEVQVPEADLAVAASPAVADLPPPNLEKIGLSIEDWKKLEDNSRQTLPSFLFRGFSSTSRGGLDPRLNSTEGIIPHKFLDQSKKPTTMYDIQGLGDMINGHLEGSVNIQTCFSSWAANFMTAKGYAYSGSGGYIAILDTSLLEKHVRVYHVPALAAAGLTCYHYDNEYLVYGPVRGNGFHCVPDKMLSRVDTAKICWPANYVGSAAPYTATTPNYLKEKVRIAKSTAALFRPSHDKRPDIIIAMTVVLCCISNSHGGLYTRVPSLNKALFNEITSQLWTEIQSLKLPGKDTAEVGLVNPSTYVKGFRSVHKMLVLLRAFEDKTRTEVVAS